jgi:hypothetical protein
MRRAIRKSVVPIPRSTATCGQSAETGRSPQNTFVKPSMAQALMVNKPAFCMAGGIRNRGNMLPPIVGMTRINSVAFESAGEQREENLGVSSDEATASRRRDERNP